MSRALPGPTPRRVRPAVAWLRGAWLGRALAATCATGAAALPAAAQPTTPPQTVAPARDVIRLPIAPGRSHAFEFVGAVTRVSVSDPDVADVLIVSDRDVIVNGLRRGESDVILWSGNTRMHYRVIVSSPDDRQQVVLAIKFAEVRREALHEFGAAVAARSRGDASGRVGTGLLRTDNAIDRETGRVTIPGEARFLTVLSDLGARDILAFLEAQEQRGNARTLAEPTLMAANREEASFLAGGEIPVPIAQPGVGGQAFVTIMFREFGVRLAFTPEVLSDSLVKLKVKPEVSSLDYGNALVLSGFRIPALRSRKLESTIDVRNQQSIVISGLFNDERERVRTGVPVLMNIPVLGHLFSSTRWQRSESELLVVVTPTIVDPNRPRERDVLRLAPDTTLPAREAIAPRLPPARDQSRPPRDQERPERPEPLRNEQRP